VTGLSRLPREPPALLDRDPIAAVPSPRPAKRKRATRERDPPRD